MSRPWLEAPCVPGPLIYAHPHQNLKTGAPGCATLEKECPMTASMPNPLLELRKLGQSVWLDDISRGMLDDGSLARLIRDDGIAGLTSNPSIFANSMMKDPKYARPIAQLLPKVSSAQGLYEELALDDLHEAAALLRRLYDSSSGGDGFVSLEVSPHLADDGPGSLKEARRLWGRLEIPNA